MKNRMYRVLLVLPLLAGGCAFDRQVAITDVVRPPAGILLGTNVAPSENMLVVYSSYDVGAAPTRHDSSMLVHTPYDIRTADGALVKHVKNDPDGRLDDTPDSV